MKTIKVSNAEELLTALKDDILEATTIQLTSDIDMNDNILTNYIAISSNHLKVTITGLHDKNQKYAIKNIQSTQSTGDLRAIFAFSAGVTFTYINFVNIYCLSCNAFATGNGTFDHCEFYGTFKPDDGFSIGTVYHNPSEYPTYKYCSFTLDNSTLWHGGTINANLSYCYIRYKSCKVADETSTNENKSNVSNSFFTGTLTNNTQQILFTRCTFEFCIFNIKMATTLTKVDYCTKPTKICLQNSSLAGNATLTTYDTLVSLTDAQMKKFDDVYATGFPIVNYTES